LALDAFFTPDAMAWMQRSNYFLEGLLTKDWMATLQTGHPGVTTMWTGSLGVLVRYLTRPPSAPNDLLTFVQQIPLDPPEAAHIAPMYFPTVLLTSLFVVAFYALISRLFCDRRVGVAAALLLALNPFFIGLSRVLHTDALATIFMTLSLLLMLGYWFQGWARGWLLLSGITAGLGFLSKSSAIFMMLFFALLGLVWAVRRWRQRRWCGWSDFGRLVTDGLLWGGAVVLTLWLLWPAMWVSPLQVLETVIGTGTTYMVEGHGKGTFFLGQISRDPGLLFYPVTWLFRTTPLTMVGFAAWAFFFLYGKSKRQGEMNSPSMILFDMLLLYIVLFTAFITLVGKKQDRYLLPIYPAIETLAALGLVQIASRGPILRRLKSQISDSRIQISILLIPILLFQGVLVATNYPYYFTYYNPLLGGAPMAARLMTVGWGEGLDQAAIYLDDLPGADQMQVTAWYHYTFGTYFRGQVTGFSSRAGETLDSNYAVVYRSQIQRELPSPELVHYLLGHHTPVFTVTLQGVDYVYVYRLPLTRRSDWQISHLPGQATFLGVGEIGLTNAKTGEENETDPISIRLSWQNDGLAVNQQWWVALQPVNGPQQPWQRCSLLPDFADERLKVGAVLESQCLLVGESLPPDVYHLRVGLGPDLHQITTVPFPEGELAIAIEDDGMLHLVSRLDALDLLARHWLPQGVHPADLVYYGSVRLVGYSTETMLTTEGRQLQVHAYWQALEPVPMAELDQAVRIESALVSPQGMVLSIKEGPFGDTENRPPVWSTGQLLMTTLSLPLPGTVPPQLLLRLNVLLNAQRQETYNSHGEMVEPNLPVFVVQ